MMENAKTPPRGMERLLERLLPEQTREHIVGDLREEYIESMLPQRGRFRANLWYARHVLSFLPAALRESSAMGMLLNGTSGFTMICMFWLASMELKLRHPGYGTRTAIDLCFAVICLLTFLVPRLTPPRTAGESSLRAGGFLMIIFGGLAFLQNARAAHFEGFVFVISLVLMLQGTLMTLTLGRSRKSNLNQPAK